MELLEGSWMAGVESFPVLADAGYGAPVVVPEPYKQRFRTMLPRRTAAPRCFTPFDFAPFTLLTSLFSAVNSLFFIVVRREEQITLRLLLRCRDSM